MIKMKNIFLSLFIAWLFLLPAAACAPVTEFPQPISGENIIALVNGTLIDGTGADPIPDAIVLINGDRILSVGSRSSVVIPKGVREIDLNGGTILPGFINAHVHDGFNKANLEAWAQGGVTTVRDEGMRSANNIAGLIALRNEASQDPKYARLVSAGLMMTVQGGYGQLYVSSADEARQKVNEELDLGVDMIKVSLEDGYAGTSGLPKLTPEQLAAIISAAHARNAQVSGHITQSAYIQQLVDSGVDDIAHLAYDPIAADTLKSMVQNGTYLTPTFTVFRNYNAPVSTCVQNLADFVRLGGKVALGNDYGGGPGSFELGIPMYEIEKMAEAGMTPMQIIQASTANAAHVVGLEGEIGVLEAGKIADVLVVAGSPLEDLGNLANVYLVMHNGTVIFGAAD